MGVFGALNAAVSGLTAQAYALENISGNIANSSTYGFKRLDTSFSDFVSGGNGPQSGQIAGGVAARSRSTNSIAGDYLPANGQDTFISIRGSGYFVVTERTGDNNGQPTFSSINYYTRAGDFEKDSAGRLVNGAGNYLLGRPIDPVTRNVAGGAPEIIKIDNSLIPAVRTNRVTLQRGSLPTNFQDGRGGPLNQSLTTTAGQGSPFSFGTRLGLDQIANANITNFINTSIGGGAVTGYTSVGEPVNVQLQWAKTNEGNSASTLSGGQVTPALTSFPGDDVFDGSIITLRRGNTVSNFTLDGTADQRDRFNSELGAAGYQLDLNGGKVNISRADGAAFEIGIDSTALATALALGTTGGSSDAAAAGTITQDPSALVGGVSFAGTVPGDTSLSGKSITLTVGGGTPITHNFGGVADEIGGGSGLNATFGVAGYTISKDASGFFRIERADGQAFDVATNDDPAGAALGLGSIATNPANVALEPPTQNASTIVGSNVLTAATDLSAFEGETIKLTTGSADAVFQIGNATTVGDLNAAFAADGYTFTLNGSGNLQAARADGAAFQLNVTNSDLATALGLTATAGTPLGSLPPTEDTWALYYNSNTDPQSPTDVAWTKIGDFQFDDETGDLIYPDPSLITISDLAVDGESLGEVIFDVPEDSLKQINAATGFQIEQNGFPAGEVVSTTINDSGRLVATYSNGRQRDLYEIPVVTFAGEAELSRRDGGTFAETSESGQPIYWQRRLDQWR